MLRNRRDARGIIRDDRQAVQRSQNIPAQVEVFLERERFIIKTVSTPEELEKAFRLRYEIFSREYAMRPQSSAWISTGMIRFATT